MPKLQKFFSQRLNHSRAPSELRVVRHLNQVRRAGVLVTAAAGGVLLVTGPALADVTVNPPTAPQGEGADLAFHVTNSGTQPVTALKLTWPADTPVAEVYPLSVADWAPRSTMQKLNTPLTTIHGGTPVTEVAKDITWLAMPGKSLAPGAATDLSVSLGPLPTLSTMPFTVVPTYAGGQVGTAMTASVKLTPLSPAEAEALHAAHGGATGTDTGPAAAQDPDAALFAQTVAQADRGPGVWTIAGWVAAALAVLGAIWFVLRNRRLVEDDAEEPDEDEQPEEKEPVAAGAARVTSWSYRDGPEG